MNSPATPDTEDLYAQLTETFQYTPRPDAFNELLDMDGQLSPSWQYLMRSMTSLGNAELAQRQRKASSLLRDDGVTYRKYSRELGPALDSAWRMDLLPWVFTSNHWQEIESGLLERAELFNLILKDLYGERALITRGIVPPEVIFGHRGYLRAANGIDLPGEHQLIQHSTDLVRGSDGQMCVLSDRTQAPSGSGYALENRIVMTRILPSVFRESNVHRLSGFFQSLRRKLVSLAPGVNAPNIAVLTPGALNETYFEHAYLANYLGFELVQSSDLTVRNNHLWMKSLDGWLPVHVLLRRVDDYFCDPVELKGDSQLGVPGLMEAVRAGNLVVANPIGSGVLETPALLAYLPEISKHFLGRELQIPSVKTWWLGDPDSLAEVDARFDELVIKPVFRSPGATSAFPSELDDAGRENLMQRVLAKPAYFVAQERVTPSQLPAIADNATLNPRPAVLRAFAVASDTSYRLMPGGLTRIGSHSEARLISNQAGSISKDTWIVASEPKKAAEASLGTDMPAREMSRVTGLPSRVVENMFWLGRYTERAEFGLRMTRTLLLQSADIGSANDDAQQLMLNAVIRASDSRQALANAGIAETMANIADILPIALDPLRRESLIGSVNAMLVCADETKELMTIDTQRVINQIRDEAQLLVSDLRNNMFSAPEEVLSPIMTSLLALSGIIHENVNRGTGWSFMDLGRRLERGIQCVKQIQYLLGERLPEEREFFVLESLLISSESLAVYRRLYRGRLEVRNVMELMLLDENHPRGLLYQLNRLHSRLAELPDSQGDSRELQADARYLLEATSMLKLARIDELSAANSDSNRRDNLDSWCQQLDAHLSQAAIALSEKYFEKPILPQQLLRQNWELPL